MPAAALVDYALHERILRLRESFADLNDKFGQVYSGVPDNNVLAWGDGTSPRIS